MWTCCPSTAPASVPVPTSRPACEWGEGGGILPWEGPIVGGDTSPACLSGGFQGRGCWLRGYPRRGGALWRGCTALVTNEEASGRR